MYILTLLLVNKLAAQCLYESWRFSASCWRKSDANKTSVKEYDIEVHGTAGCCLVEGSSAVLGSAQARDLLVLDGEFIIVCDLLVDADRLPRIDDNFLFGFYGDDFSIAVWLNVNKRTFKR